MSNISPGRRFREALTAERPLQIAGAVNALCAMQAERAGFLAIYLSGAGVANASYGMPDLGVTNLGDVLIDARRITAVTELPLLVDIDTGWGTELTIRRTIHELERIGVAAVHIEDQVFAKRCGHRPGKELVEASEMAARIGAAVSARNDDDFVVMARTDAIAVEGIDAAVERARIYVEAGADMIFAEAVEKLEDFQRFSDGVGVPILANMTEFGRTPSFAPEELRTAGVAMALYPLTAFRAMNAAAKSAYETLRRDGTQRSILDRLQTREELYRILNYHSLEQEIDRKRAKP